MIPRITWRILVGLLGGLPFLGAQPFVWDGPNVTNVISDTLNWVDNVAPDPEEGLFDAVFGELQTNTSLLEQTIQLRQVELSGTANPLLINTLTFESGRPAYTFTIGSPRDTSIADLWLYGDVNVQAGQDVVFDAQLKLDLIGGDHTLDIDAGATLEFLGDIGEQGAAKLIKTGDGTLVLGGEPGGRSTFTGGFEVQEGTLRIGRSSFEDLEETFTSPVGSGILTLFGGTTLTTTLLESDFEADGILLMNPIGLRSGVATIETIETDLILSGIIAENIEGGGIEKIGSGTLTLQNSDSSFSGGVTVHEGTLAIGASSVFEGELFSGPVGTGTLTLGRDTRLELAGGNGTLHNTIVLDHLPFGAAEGDLTVDMGEGVLALYGDINDGDSVSDDPLTLVKTAPGTLVLGGYGNFSGGVTVMNGTLQLDQSSGVGGTYGPVGSGLLTLFGGTTLSAGMPVSIANLIEIYDGTVTFGNADNGEYELTVTGSISGDADLTVVGSVRLTGVSDLTGNVAIESGGVLSISTDNALPQGVALSLFPYSTLNVGFDQTIERFIDSDVLAEIIIATGAEFTIDLAEWDGGTSFLGNISGEGSLRIAAPEIDPDFQTVILAGHNSYTGGTIVEAGAALRIGDGESSSSITGDIANDGFLYLQAGNEEQPLLIDGIVSGSGTVVVDGGVTRLTGQNTYTGGTIIHSTATVISATSFGSNPFGDLVVNNTITVNGGGTLALDDSFVGNVIQLNGTLGGNGFVDTLAVGGGAVVAPGLGVDTIGSLTFNDLTLADGGVFEWNLLDPANHAGGYDRLFITSNSSTLHVEASSADPFQLRLITLSSPGTMGQAFGLEPGGSWQWTLIDASGSSIQGFSADKFDIDTTDFDVGFAFQDTDFELFVVNNMLKLSFTPVPEPSTYALMVLGLLGIGARTWRRRR